MARFLNICKLLPAPLITVYSFYLSSLSVIEYPDDLKNLSDKLIHVVCFGGLTAAWSWYFSYKNWREHYWRDIAICIIGVSLYGAFDEFHQSFVPGREVSFYDWVADTAGAVIGSFAGEISIRVAVKMKALFSSMRK